MELEQRLINIEETLAKTQILLRVNNLLLSRFILQLANVRKEFGLPKRNTFFKFELLQDDYEELVNEFTKKEVDKALYTLDRMLLTNRLQCPHNIKKYIHSYIKKNLKRREEYRNNNNSKETKGLNNNNG